jgi:hypothetical protein
MVNQQALEAYQNRGARKQIFSIKPVAVVKSSVVVKPTILPEVISIDKQIESRDVMIASLEAQLAALKSLTVSTPKKVS